MNPTDKATFTKAVQSTLSIYGKKANETDMEVWFRALKEYPMRKVEDAFDAHAKFGRYAPKPADIVGRINGTNEKGEVNEGGTKYNRPPLCEVPGCINPPASFDPAHCHAHVRQPPDQWATITAEILAGNIAFPPTITERCRAEMLAELGRFEELKAMRHEVVEWARQETRAGRIKPGSFVADSAHRAEVEKWLGVAKRDPGYQPPSQPNG